MAHEESKPHDQGPRNPENPPRGPALRLKPFELRRRPRLLQQTHTYGPGWQMADLAGCDVCGVQVTRGTLEEIRACTLGGRPIEFYACRSCGDQMRAAGSPPLPSTPTQTSGEPAAEPSPAGRVGGAP